MNVDLHRFAGSARNQLLERLEARARCCKPSGEAVSQGMGGEGGGKLWRFPGRTEIVRQPQRCSCTSG